MDSTAEDYASSEINLLRVLLIRSMAAARRARRLSLKERASVLAAISSSGIIMASLVRFEGKYHNPFTELGDTLLQAYAAMDPYDL